LGSNALGSGTATIGANDLHLFQQAGTSYFAQVQALFTTSPVVLVNPSDYIDLAIVFTGSNILASATNSSLNVGLYNSNSGSGQTFSETGYALTSSTNSPSSGFAQNYRGYIGRIFGSTTGSIISRTLQTGTTGQNQDLLFSGASSSSSFNSPTGTAVTSSGTTNLVLSSSVTYTIDYNISVGGSNNLLFSENVYSGSGTGGTILYGRTANTGAAALVTSTFDGLALGWRFNNGNAASGLDISSINVTTNTGVVPEPATFAMVFGGFAMLMGWNRFRRR
jgi:hypothetical protein